MTWALKRFDKDQRGWQPLKAYRKTSALPDGRIREEFLNEARLIDPYKVERMKEVHEK